MKRTLVALVATISLAFAACGDTPASNASDGDVPRRIVSLSATATETLFAIGADSQVVAVDDQSNFPKRAPKTKLSAHEPNVEAITAYNPDLIVIAGDTKNLTAELTKLSIPVLDLPAAKTLDEAYDQIETLGDRTGRDDEAGELVATMRRRIDKLTREAPARATPLTYYHELDDTLFSVTSQTFIGEIYKRAGLVSVADAADPEGASGGYPQLSAEFLVEADPDLVFLADTKCCAQTAATFAARPGFATLKAVAGNHVVALDDDIASRWGPRVVDFLARIVAAAKTVPAA